MTTDADIRAQAADLIDGALDVLAERGWCQRVFVNKKGQVCLEAALTTAYERATGQEGVYSYGLARRVNAPAWMVAYKALCGAADGTAVPVYNDFIAESVEDVALLAKRAAHSLRTEVA